MTCFLLLLKKQSIETIRSGFLSHKYEYKLNYTVGQKTIDGVGFSTSTFDLSKVDGGLALDGGYTLNGDKTLDVNSMQFINPDNVNSTNTYTLLDWSKVTGDGTFSVTNGGDRCENRDYYQRGIYGTACDQWCDSIRDEGAHLPGGR